MLKNAGLGRVSVSSKKKGGEVGGKMADKKNVSMIIPWLKISSDELLTLIPFPFCNTDCSAFL